MKILGEEITKDFILVTAIFIGMLLYMFFIIGVMGWLINYYTAWKRKPHGIKKTRTSKFFVR